MIHGYHMVLCTYGFWLPNDVRGSMSQKVYSPRLSALGLLSGRWNASQLHRRLVSMEREVE